MLFALCFSAEAQQLTKVARIGAMITAEPGLEMLRQGLRERGYFEGKNIRNSPSLHSGKHRPDAKFGRRAFGAQSRCSDRHQSDRHSRRQASYRDSSYRDDNQSRSGGHRTGRKFGASGRQSDRSCQSHPRSKRKAARAPKGSRPKDISRGSDLGQSYQFRSGQCFQIL